MFHLQVALEDWPEGFNNLTFDNFIANPGHTGSGFELRNNTIMNNRGRGMLVKAGNGIVEGNTVIRPTFWPLQVSSHRQSQAKRPGSRLVQCGYDGLADGGCRHCFVYSLWPLAAGSPLWKPLATILKVVVNLFGQETQLLSVSFASLILAIPGRCYHSIANAVMTPA